MNRHIYITPRFERSADAAFRTPRYASPIEYHTRPSVLKSTAFWGWIGVIALAGLAFISVVAAK